MKYLITENQRGKILDFIKDFIDGYFSPVDDFGDKMDWEKTRQLLKDTYDGEVFLFFGDIEEQDYMSFYNCEYVEDMDLDLDCPHLSLEPKDYEKLDAMFGNAWKPIMMDWFKSNTGFEIKDIYIFE